MKARLVAFRSDLYYYFESLAREADPFAVPDEWHTHAHVRPESPSIEA